MGDEKGLLSRLNKPVKIQNYLNNFPYHYDKRSPSLCSPRVVLQKRRANCIEGALLAATALWYHGREPLLLDLVSDKSDLDHVVALFKEGRYWGAISKTNHVILRYREPVYKNVRELAMSYFHEYFLDNGKKTLRSFSEPFYLSRLPDASWVTSSDDLWELAERLDNSPHHKILSPDMARRLRLADKIERAVAKLIEW
ncbi:MAG TPA: hypothetical protein VJI73_00515 [Candidatus Paceibacterota bacterium]